MGSDSDMVFELEFDSTFYNNDDDARCNIVARREKAFYELCVENGFCSSAEREFYLVLCGPAEQRN